MGRAKDAGGEGVENDAAGDGSPRARLVAWGAIMLLGCTFSYSLGWQKGWTFYPTNANEQVISEAPKLGQPDSQNIKELFADFLNAINTGTKPVSDIGEIQLSTNMALLGMLSLKHGRSIEWDGAKERIVGDDAANKLLRREYRKGWEYPKA